LCSVTGSCESTSTTCPSTAARKHERDDKNEKHQVGEGWRADREEREKKEWTDRHKQTWKCTDVHW
jgi:hypothetical protein